MRDLRQLMEQAKQNLRESGSLLPALIIQGGQDALVGLQDLPNTAEGRRLLLFALGRRFAAGKPRRLIAVMDAYMKVDDLGLELPLKASLADDPAATDCIVVASLDRHGRSRALVCPYERLPGLEGLEIEFGAVKEMPGQAELFLLQAFFDGVRSG